MSNERDRISEYFEAKGVSRGEFEALKRFGDYKELADGTLMRMEGNKEFRIYCEDSGWLRGRNGGRGVLVTSGFCRVLSEAHERVMEKVKKEEVFLCRHNSLSGEGNSTLASLPRHSRKFGRDGFIDLDR
jgi:hypothetical protein